MKQQIKSILLSSLIISFGTLVITAVLFGEVYTSDAETLLKIFIMLNIVSLAYRYWRYKEYVILSTLAIILTSLMMTAALGLVTFII